MVSASEMTYFVSSGALHSTHSPRHMVGSSNGPEKWWGARLLDRAEIEARHQQAC